MGKYRNKFPLIADDELVIQPIRTMQLEELGQRFDQTGSFSPRPNPEPSKEEQEQDKPRQPRLVQRPLSDPLPEADHVQEPVQEPKAIADQEPSSDGEFRREGEAFFSPTRDFISQEKAWEGGGKSWAYYAQALRQTEYILAELPRFYEPPQNPSRQGTYKQNFDFLKNSKIYNPSGRKPSREQARVQELNLTTFDDRY